MPGWRLDTAELTDIKEHSAGGMAMERAHRESEELVVEGEEEGVEGEGEVEEGVVGVGERVEAR